MSDNARIVNYEFERDPKGVRIRTFADGKALPCWALLWITLTEDGSGPVTFKIDRILQLPGNILEFHGYTTDRVALDGQFRYREETGGFDIGIQVLNASDPMRVRIGLHIELTGEADPRWMVPGVFYRDNHVEGNERVYPRFTEIHRDPARMMSSAWSFRSDRAALPSVFCWTYTMLAWVAVQEVVGATEESPEGAGMTSVHLGCEDGHPRLGYEFPYRESPVKFSYCHEDRTEAEELYIDLPANTPLALRGSLGFGPPDLHGYDTVLRALAVDRAATNLLPETGSPEAIEEDAIHGIKRWHLEVDAAMIHETSSFDKHFGRRGTNVERQHMHCGWMSGMMPAYNLLWSAREAKDKRLAEVANLVVDLLVGELAPCGSLWPLYTHGKGFSEGTGPAQGLAHSRTIGEAVLYLARAFRLELLANAAHPSWLKAIESNLDFIVKAQRPDGAFPSYYNLQSGEAYSYEGVAGLAWVAALAAGSPFLQKPAYREAARRAGNHYARMVNDEFLYGGNEDAPLIPVADDGHIALISYVHLYEFDLDPRWLDLARRAADYALTWRMTYNVGFNPLSQLGRYGIRTRGGDITSVASPVLAPIGLMSYPELLRLSGLTGDPYYAERAAEGYRFALQLVSRADGEFNARRGHVAAHIFHTDWWQPKGMMLSLGHAWVAGFIKGVGLINRHMVLPQVEAERAGLEASLLQQHEDNWLEEVVRTSPPGEIREMTRFDSGGFESEMGWKVPSFLSSEEVRLPNLGSMVTPSPREVASSNQPVTPARTSSTATKQIKLPKAAPPTAGAGRANTGRESSFSDFDRTPPSRTSRGMSGPLGGLTPPPPDSAFDMNARPPSVSGLQRLPRVPGGGDRPPSVSDVAAASGTPGQPPRPRLPSNLAEAMGLGGVKPTLPPTPNPQRGRENDTPTARGGLPPAGPSAPFGWRPERPATASHHDEEPPTVRQSRAVPLPPPSFEPFSLSEAPPPPPADPIEARQLRSVPPPPPPGQPFSMKPTPPGAPAPPAAGRSGGVPPPPSEPFSLGSVARQPGLAPRPNVPLPRTTPRPVNPGATPRPFATPKPVAKTPRPSQPPPPPPPDPDKEDSKKIPIPPRKDGSNDSGEIEIKWKIF